MASTDHQQLAAFIKQVHEKLRIEFRKHGAEEAWKSHCSQRETLLKYADAMKELATKYWDVNAADQNSKARSRIEWVTSHCVEYFVGGGKLKERNKEENTLRFIELQKSATTNIRYQSKELSGDSKLDSGIGGEPSLPSTLHLLDVGSCYNPFKVFPLFSVLPIDLVPASSDVFQCDFLNLKVSPVESQIKQDNSIITELPEEAFDVLVFSLLLEYIPCSEQRYICCQKAYNLLKTEGLLFIITPDSKHQSANAAFMKMWRTSLSYLGFSRIYYEKLPHLHCMAYRKSPYPELARKFWMLQTEKEAPHELLLPYLLMQIPQDCHKSTGTENDSMSAIIPPVERSEVDNDIVTSMFLELPNL